MASDIRQGCVPGVLTVLTLCCQVDIDAQQQATEMEERRAFGMAEHLILHGEPYTEHKSTFQVGVGRSMVVA